VHNFFFQQNKTLIWKCKSEILQILPWGHNSLRVCATENIAVRYDLPGALLDSPSTDVEIIINEDCASIQNGNILAKVSLEGGVRFLKAETGEELLAENPAHLNLPPARYFKAVSGDLYRIEARFKSYPNERITGLGQHQHGLLDQKGSVIDLMQKNTEVNIPFLQSNRGYGFLWNNPAVGRVEFATNGTRWIGEATQQMDYWITVGDTPAAIMKHYVDATGHVPLLPEWAAGFWQCKLRYYSQEVLLEVAREHKRRGLPLSVIVADFFHWTHQGEWQFDLELWPDPEAMVRELNELGIKLMVSVWPTVNAISANYEEMQQRGLLVRNERGVPGQFVFVDTDPKGPVAVTYYDATNPEAREYIWKRIREGYYQYGIKVWWLDACEPEIYPYHPENLRFHLGNGQAVANIYPLLHARAFYDGMRAEGEEEVILLCRSAWAGSQRYGAALWSGDIVSTFESLRSQVTAGLNAGLSGIPWWTTDIGGFHDGNPQTPYFRELIVRWFQYGVFCPLFRLHGFRQPETLIDDLVVGAPNEVWSFGEEAYSIIKELLFLRERLRPYIMEQMRTAHHLGTPPMRPLFFDFPDDEDCSSICDQFLFGPDLLVAPVLAEGVRSREVYLPKGLNWRDAWTNEIYGGGQKITVDAPLERIPLFIREGVKLPILGT
jgi:alpha-D-xyloside xylohydrolase